MKKIIVFVAFSLLAAAQAFAGASADTQTMNLTASGAITGGTVYGDRTAATATSSLIGKTSTGVGFGAKTGLTGYAIVTQHKSGDKGIGGSFNSTTLVYKPVASIGTPILDVPGKSDSTAFDATWLSL